MLRAPDLLGRRLLFFTGKGGVGKSTVTAAMALLASERGKRVLVVEVDGKSSIADRFETAELSFTPTEVYPNVFAMAMDTEASLKEYLKLNLRVPIVGGLGPLAKALDFVATAAPGVKEILTIGKICWEVRESLEGRAAWDLVVVDASATGHVVSQLGAPDAIRDVVAVGPVRSQTDWMSALLADPSITALNIVATAEELPVAETIDLVSRVREQLDVSLGAVVVNQVLPALFTRSDEVVFERLCGPDAREVLGIAAGGDVGVVLEAARLAVSLRTTRATHLERLRETVDLPMLFLPYLFARSHGLRETRLVADALGAELGL